MTASTKIPENRNHLDLENASTVPFANITMLKSHGMNQIHAR